jgi:hypothetical protein
MAADRFVWTRQTSRGTPLGTSGQRRNLMREMLNSPCPAVEILMRID